MSLQLSLFRIITFSIIITAEPQGIIKGIVKGIGLGMMTMKGIT